MPLEAFSSEILRLLLPKLGLCHMLAEQLHSVPQDSLIDDLGLTCATVLSSLEQDACTYADCEPL